jgi:hypothetical protein
MINPGNPYSQDILPARMLSLALAELNGRETGVFSHSSKVTAEE